MQHRREGSARWVPQQAGGLFKKGNALIVEANSSIEEGEVITMDFGSAPEERLDSQVLLDYGEMDVDRSQVHCLSLTPDVILGLMTSLPRTWVFGWNGIWALKYCWTFLAQTWTYQQLGTWTPMHQDPLSMQVHVP